MIVANNLSKIYKLKEKRGLFSFSKTKEIVAVKDVSMNIYPGKIVGLLGVNGAGKTTTIKMLSSLLEPTDGTITVDGIDALRYPNKVKKIINVITGGERNIYWRLTARENLEYFGALYNIPKKLLSSKIDELINLVNLKEAIDIPVERYSKGMKQRLQIARGLINDPKFLFLDEPTLGLDIVVAKELRNYMKNLAIQEGRGILLTTHYINEIEELCDIVYVMDKGKIIMVGTPQELAASSQNGIRVSITVTTSIQNILQQLEDLAKQYRAEISVVENNGNLILSITANENLTAHFVKRLTDMGIFIQQLKVIEPKLEDALMKLSVNVS